jgi:hypothetical protein
LAAALALSPWMACAATQPPPALRGMTMMTVIQTRPQHVGDRYSYVAETQAHTSRDGVVHDSQSRQRFTLEVVSVDSSGMTVRFTQTSVEQTPPGGDAPSALLLQAWDGVPVDFRTSASGEPTAIVGAAEAKTRLEANFAGLSPKAPAMGPDLKQWLDAMPDSDLINLIGDKLSTLAAMQWRGVVKIGHQDLPGETHKDADGTDVLLKRSVDFAPSTEVACSVLVRRSTWTERPGSTGAISSRLDTDATVAEADGWVINLTEVTKTVLPTVQQTKTVKITREASQGCHA